VAQVQRVLRELYTPAAAGRVLALLERFLTRAQAVAGRQGLDGRPQAVLEGLLDHSPLAGGRYPQPRGEKLLRAFLAEQASALTGLPVSVHELVPMLGASHGVATLFKLLGAEGLGWLRPGDAVVTVSPAYAPFVELFEGRGLRVLTLSLDPCTGAPRPGSLEALARCRRRIKAVFLVTPNNPTGCDSTPQALAALAALAQRDDALLVSDEVYAPFFAGTSGFGSLPEARRRWLRVSSLSKIERSAGLRVGDLWLSDEANDSLSRGPLRRALAGCFPDLRTGLLDARSPGGSNLGLFRHITGLPGPSAALALCHLALGEAERARFVASVAERGRIFYRALGLTPGTNRYFGLLDLERLDRRGRRLPMEARLTAMAQEGLVLLPAHRFFSAADRARGGTRCLVRVSLPNLDPDQIEAAAGILCAHLRGVPKYVGTAAPRPRPVSERLPWTAVGA
jgi:aspartate/methionine/tyrosine aminotransferase